MPPENPPAPSLPAFPSPEWHLSPYHPKCKCWFGPPPAISLSPRLSVLLPQNISPIPLHFCHRHSRTWSRSCHQQSPARHPCSSPPASLHPPRGIFVKRSPTHLAPGKLLTVAWRGRVSPSKAHPRPLPLTWGTLASLLPLTGQSLPHWWVLAPALSPPHPALALAPRPVGCPRSPSHHSKAHPPEFSQHKRPYQLREWVCAGSLSVSGT